MADRHVAALAGLLLVAAPFVVAAAGAQVAGNLSPHLGASLPEWMSLHQVPAASIADLRRRLETAIADL